jgi:hypothetical protein
MAGKHHEIYLSDPRRTDPPNLRTILRQPVEPADGREEPNLTASPETRPDHL